MVRRTAGVAVVGLMLLIAVVCLHKVSPLTTRLCQNRGLYLRLTCLNPWTLTQSAGGGDVTLGEMSALQRRALALFVAAGHTNGEKE